MGWCWPSSTPKPRARSRSTAVSTLPLATMSRYSWPRSFLFSAPLATEASSGSSLPGPATASFWPKTASRKSSLRADGIDDENALTRRPHDELAGNAHYLAGTCDRAGPNRQGHQHPDRPVHRAESEVSEGFRPAGEDPLHFADSRPRRPYRRCSAGG